MELKQYINGGAILNRWTTVHIPGYGVYEVCIKQVRRPSLDEKNLPVVLSLKENADESEKINVITNMILFTAKGISTILRIEDCWYKYKVEVLETYR